MANYTNNALNQITGRGVPGYVNLLGRANSNATVTLWTGGGRYAPTTRQGDYFRGELATNNLSGPVWLTVTNLAVLNNGTNDDIITNVVGNVFLAKTPETFAYDVDGNLTNDGHWTYTWDGENRLVKMVANTGVGPQQCLQFDYDAKGRRLRKQVWNNTAGTGTPAVDQRFVYDGWNLMAILSSELNLLSSFTWGLDLSGTAQGAGGVGGLLWINDTANGTHFAAFDGNGNLTALVKATDGSVSANYDYGPFGEVLRQTGPMAQVNPFRFSTKFTEDETGLLYYGYRSYNPTIGRWLSRDPIGGDGGDNLYGFVGNDPANTIDPLGQDFIAVVDCLCQPCLCWESGFTCHFVTTRHLVRTIPRRESDFRQAHLRRVRSMKTLFNCGRHGTRIGTSFMFVRSRQHHLSGPSSLSLSATLNEPQPRRACLSFTRTRTMDKEVVKRAGRRLSPQRAVMPMRSKPTQTGMCPRHYPTGQTLGISCSGTTATRLSVRWRN